MPAAGVLIEAHCSAEHAVPVKDNAAMPCGDVDVERQCKAECSVHGC